MPTRSSAFPFTGLRVTLTVLAAVALAVLTASPAFAATGTIQIVQGGIGEGRIVSSPAGIDCTITATGATGTCAAAFEEGTRVRLRAFAADNSKFAGWAPVTSCMKGRVTVVAGATHSCQPVFELTEPRDFLLQAIPEGSGTVTQEAGGVVTTSCTTDVDAGTVTGGCAWIYPTGTVVTLTATPLPGWTFTGWRTESTDGKDDDCADGIVTMDQAERCIAVFVRT